MRGAFPRVYNSFQEFEREELHKLNMTGAIDDMLGEMAVEELDFSTGDGEKKRGRKRAVSHDED
jgi:hypothetical protein